jgi:hypothetical protein
MAEIKLDPVLGELSPNIFKAAIEAGLPPSQQTQLNQMAHARKEAKRLLQLSKENGRKEFLQFDPIVQDNIRYLYSKEDRFAPELTPLGRGIQAVGKSLSNTAKLYFSPIIAGFTAADKYYKTINTPYQVEQQAEQRMGKRFSKKLITEAFDGKNSWRWDKISEYEAKHGKALVTLVRGISEGRTPGESIDLYGTDDESMVKAIQFMGDEPEQFNELLKEIKTFAQVSPGRDKVGSMLKADPEVNQSYWATKLLKKVGIDLTDKKTRTGVASLVSGPLDATYQIGIDPLTYTGAGPILKGAYRIGRGIKGIPEAIGRFGGIKSRGERLADQFVFLSERGNVEGGVDFVFKQADVIKLWDEQLGKVVKNYADAEGPVAKGLVYKQIRIDFPEWANLDVVKKLAKEEVFDATSAKRFFMDHEDMGLLLSGRVDNLNYRRNGIPVAKNFRSLTSASHKVIDAIFNPTAKNLNVQSYLEKGEKELSTVLDVLKKVADDGENLVNPAIKDIIELQTDISKTRKMMKKMSVGFTRSPGRILYGEDAIKTESDVRNLAMLALGKKDTAYAFTEQFLTESPEIQLTMIRNLYAAVMMRSGMLGSPKGQTIADEILAATFNETGMFSTVKSQIPLDLVGTLHPALVRREGEDFFQASKGIVQPSQVARSIAPLPYDLIYQTAASSRLSEKINFINLVGGATRNKFTKFYTDFWTNNTLFPRLGIRSSVDEAFFGFLTQSTAALRSFVFGGRAGRSTLEATTGSKTTQGMYKRGFYKIFPSKDPTQKLDNQERLNILEDTRAKLSKQYGYEVALADVAHQAIREETLLRVQDLYAGKMGPATMETVTRLMKYSPNVLDSMGNSVAARSMMTGKIDIEYVDSVFVSSNLTKAIQEAGLALGKKYRAIDINKMTTKQIALAHFDNWNIRFSYNSEKIANGAVVNPVNAFYRYKALKTNDDFINARHSILKDVGVERVPKGFNDDYIVASGTKLDGFLSLFSTTVLYRQRGIPDVQIARIHVENMLMDMRNTFHGGPTNYNEKLFEAVKAAKLKIQTNVSGPQINLKAIAGGNAGKGTPLGDAKDIAMRSESDAAIVELVDVNIQKNITKANPEGIGKTSSETSLLRLGPATSNLSGKTIMLARNGKLAGKELRPETIKSITDANAAGARFIVGDMPNVDSQFIDLLNKINAEYIVYHTGNKSRINIIPRVSETVKDAWSKASAEIDFPRFEDLTQGYQPGTNIQTRLYNLGPEKDMKIFEEEAGFNHLYSKWQNWTMDVMDATVTGIYRQPMLLLFTERALKDLKPYEKVFKDRYVRNAIEENPLLSKGIAEVRGKEHAERQVTNLALTRATEELLEYVDNPSVRTNFAISIRSVGRFYRATEDFYRRVWRLYTKKPLQSLYRLRLLHTGLEASGDVYEDEKGDKFIIFPTDSIINGAVEPILRTLTGNSTINVPSFNEFTLKLRLLNPSFSPDAGQPALAGPIGSVAVVISRALLRELPFVPAPIKEQIQPSTTQFAEKFDSIALGQFGDRMTLRSALVPMFADTIFSTLSPTEWDRQKGTAMLQAIAWGQAFGNGLPTNATTKEKADYISKLKISANSTIVARNMLGQISPGQPTLRDSKELPKFLKKTGITTWKSSFYDVYNGLLRNAENEDTDVFDLAIATWVGQNPGKVIYLVPRNTKEFKVLINTTDEVKNWSIKNKKFIDTYKEIGYLFAPKAGEYNPDIYAWMQSEGLVDIPEFQDYLEDVQVAEDKQKYFAIEDKLNEALKKKSVYGDRRQLIDKAAQERTALLISNPYLDAEISGKGTNRGNLKVMFKTLSDAVADPKSPIDKQTRSSMNLAIRNVADFLNLAEDPELSNRFDFSEMKSNRKQQVVKILTELGKINPEVKEANRIIFTGLLNYYSRESVIAGIEGR